MTLKLKRCQSLCTWTTPLVTLKTNWYFTRWGSLKELRNYKQKVIFVSATKTGENTANILKLLFFTIYLLFVTSNQIPTYGRPNLPLTSSIYLDFLLLEIRGRFEQAKVYHTFFYFVWKETPHEPLKVAAAKNPFLQCVCYWYNLLRWTFFILRDSRHYFSWKFIVSLRLLKRHVAAFFEASVLKEVLILCVISTITERY